MLFALGKHQTSAAKMFLLPEPQAALSIWQLGEQKSFALLIYINYFNGLYPLQVKLLLFESLYLPAHFSRDAPKQCQFSVSENVYLKVCLGKFAIRHRRHVQIREILL